MPDRTLLEHTNAGGDSTGSSAPSGAQFHPYGIASAVHQIRSPLSALCDRSGRRVGVLTSARESDNDAHVPSGTHLLGTLPPLYPEWLGDRSFCEAHGVRFPYIAGEMANGIATTRLVIEMVRAGMLAFFGAAGLGPATVERAIKTLHEELGPRGPWGVNLIHSPYEPALEDGVAEILLKWNVPRISASAFTALTPAVVRCAASGLRTDRQGEIQRPRKVFAKVSHPTVAERFLSPPPRDVLRTLVDREQLTPTEAELAGKIPVAEDITVEADSGGHTDNRPMSALLPSILAMRDSMTSSFGYTDPIRIGVAGGLGTPRGVASAFAMGAAYVLTGTINQASVESGLSEDGKSMLAEADLTDVTMAPAADMFEAGVQVQLLRRGTLFAARAKQLYDTYRAYNGLNEIPQAERTDLERRVLRSSLEEVWNEVVRFWHERDPAELRRAENDPKHAMALTFRWYLGNSSRWAIKGDQRRRSDYQIWCGPAMGAFNRWVSGSWLDPLRNRSVVQIARNLLEGAAVATRAHQIRTFGAPLPDSAGNYVPRRLVAGRNHT
ncbi:PfaD family polyunsaturated fatty acid/polyketide biosynthesis protein [Actinopolyspora mortivallis]|uniref:2-nitropropane dioxygenase n=1 Tax=Actinopolyspora mortivallis TaxID=33906 RepID=A0A2T0GWL4_ACTMO|nr:PfaD family polyunsaturated fatty acid/polyketide biosynthesis protein [Actinopolyspora mortivallis]PRW63501.1 2-nitropropane dioxygenase [Actinopolyspora mortivallis]